MNTISKSRRRIAPAASTLRRLPLGSLRVFVAVAEQQSFTRAASALGVTVSAASMQIQALESYLGLPLFRRDGRKVELTDDAQLLLPRIRNALGELQAALDEVRTMRESGALHVSTLHSFLLQWLLPRLRDFSARHPEIDLRMETSPHLVDFHRSGIHAAIRFGAGKWPGLHSERLLSEWLVPVCQPALLDRLGPVHGTEELARYRLLHSSSEPWSAWLGTADLREVWPERGVGFDDSTAIVRAAESGEGLALARWSLVVNEVASGRLAVASRKVTPYPRSYHFVCPPKALQLRKVQNFRDWVRSQAATHPAPKSR